MLSDNDQLLISAYIDGEVSPDERLRAEQLLVDDAAARAFREELLSMSAQLQSLPRHTLPADFSGEVLAAAERAMFVGQPWPGDAAVESSSIWSRVFNARTIAYAGATIAAAILVTLFIPHNNAPNVAENTAVEKNTKTDETPTSEQSDPIDAELAAPGEARGVSGVDEKDLTGKKDVESLKARLNQLKEVSRPEDDSKRVADPIIESGPQPGGKYADSGDRDAISPAADDSFGAQSLSTAPKPARGLGRSRKNAEPPLMVVSIDIGETALRDRTLQQVLAAHRVQSKDRGNNIARRKEHERESLEEAAKKNAEFLDARPSTQTVYAEMSRSQLNNVLAQLKTDPKLFSSVALYSGETALQLGGTAGSGSRYWAAGEKTASKPTDLEKKREVQQTTVPATADADKTTQPGAGVDPGKVTSKHDGPRGDSKKPSVDKVAESGATGAGSNKGKKKVEAEGFARDSPSRRAINSASGKPGIAAERVRVLFVLRTPAQSTESSAAEPTPAAPGSE